MDKIKLTKTDRLIKHKHLTGAAYEQFEARCKIQNAALLGMYDKILSLRVQEDFYEGAFSAMKETRGKLEVEFMRLVKNLRLDEEAFSFPKKTKGGRNGR